MSVGVYVTEGVKVIAGVGLGTVGLGVSVGVIAGVAVQTAAVAV